MKEMVTPPHTQAERANNAIALAERVDDHATAHTGRVDYDTAEPDRGEPDTAQPEIMKVELRTN